MLLKNFGVSYSVKGLCVASGMQTQQNLLSLFLWFASCLVFYCDQLHGDCIGGKYREIICLYSCLMCTVRRADVSSPRPLPPRSVAPPS